MNRRAFLRVPAAGALVAADAKPVRVGMIGVGGRGSGLMSVLLQMNNVAIPAICDIDQAKVERAQAAVEKSGRAKPADYSRGEEDFRRLLERTDLDAVVIATPWHWHTPMGVAAMKAGKYAAIEVPCAITYQQCWDLVNTHEQTGVPAMMLENWSFRRDNLAVLNMIRQGLLGQIVHCHCAHSHDCIDHWFFDPQGRDRWPADYLVKRNADQYSTHSLGPVLSWMGINCGDAFAYLTATATRSLGINTYFTKKFGADHPNARRKYAQGDIVTSVVKTVTGNSIVINYDMQLPRPYDNRWMIQGTNGLYSESRNAVYIHGTSPKYHEWEPFDPYQTRYEHTWWKQILQEASEASHGGTDYLELREFLRAVANRTQTPIDVYDSVTMSVITPLSEESIAKGSAPVSCPDFTRGKWRTRKPTFGMV